MSLSLAVCFASRVVEASLQAFFVAPFLRGAMRAAPMSSPTDFRRVVMASYFVLDFFGAEDDATCFSNSPRIG